MPLPRKVLGELCAVSVLLVLGTAQSGVAVAQAPINACTYLTSGMDMSEAINAAMVANPGAVIDARCFPAYATGTTPQTWSVNIFNSVSGPGELLLGTVNVTVAAQQNIPSGWRIAGAGPGVTILTAATGANNGNLGAVFQIGSVTATQSNTSSVQIENLEINGNGTNEVDLPIQIQAAVGVWVKNSYIHDGQSTNIGIDTNNPLAGSSQVHIQGNRVGATHGCNAFDVQAGPKTTDFFIKDNFIFGGSCYGIGADGSSHGVISGNDISAGGTAAGGGIQVEATNGTPSHIVIANNDIHDFTATSTAFGIAFVIGASSRNLSDVLIEGNVIANYAGRGIAVGNLSGFSGTACLNATVKGNTIHNTTLAGIRVVGCNIAQVEGNNIYNVGTALPNNDDQDGIAISNTTGFIVSGNTVTDISQSTPTTRYAINLDGTTGDGVIVNNYAKGTASGPISNTATGGDIQVLTNHTT